MTRFLLAAIVAGLVAGIVMTAVQMVRVVPLIMQAEIYEQGTAPAHDDAGTATHDHAPATMADGWQRHAKTMVANMIVGASFALILTAAIMLLNQAMTLKAGLAWGIGGFIAFVLAPNFGLPPELPGTGASDLVDRQVWWVATAVLTAGGLLLLAFRQKPIWIATALAMILAPHVWGAPEVVHLESALPPGLAADFASATVVTSAIFWLALGALLGFMLGRAQQAEHT